MAQLLHHNFPLRGLALAAGVAAALAVASGAAAAPPPVFPAVWYYRDTFKGESSIDRLTPETAEGSAGPGQRRSIPLDRIKTLWLIVPADQPAPAIEFAGKSYALREEGLFRFLSRPEDRTGSADSGIRNLIFLHTTDSTIPFLRGISRLIAHGSRDESQSIRTLDAHLIDQPWAIATCGRARDILAAALHELSPKYAMRRVDTVDAADPGNGFDDGHSVLEVSGGAFAGWTMVDIDQGLLFRTGGDEFLSTESLIGALAKGEPVRYEMLSPKEMDLQFYSQSPAFDGYNFAVYEQQILRDPLARANWYRRVLQRPQYSPMK